MMGIVQQWHDYPSVAQGSSYLKPGGLRGEHNAAWGLTNVTAHTAASASMMHTGNSKISGVRSMH